jgi:hypothetical protein
MTHKKAKHKPAKRRKGLSAGGHRSTVRRKKRKGLFDGSLSKHNLLEHAKTVGLGALGGAGASFGNKLLAGFKMGFWGKTAVGAGGGLVVAMFGAPRMAAGFAGGMAALATTESGLHDDDLQDENLEDLPVYQTEDGNYVKMLSDGEIVPLSDDEVDALHDGDQIYPPYGTQHNM